MEALYGTRMEGFRAELEKRGGEAFLVSKPPNIRYLSGFTGDSAWLFVTGREMFLFTDSRYTGQAKEECPGWRVAESKTGLVGALKEACAELEVKELTFDRTHITVDLRQRLLLALGRSVQLCGEEDPCHTLRRYKDAWELTQMEKAADTAARALALLRPRIKPGVSERELALELDYQMGKMGSESPSFATIAAAGPQGAWPHARPTDYRLREGDMITFDFGAVVNGYHSDMTRTFILGRPDRLQAERYTLVLQAQEKALSGVRAGATVRAVDRLAREHLAGAGLGDYFGHGLGHSLGLEIHEEPRFSPLAEDIPLAAGMVMTVEPGIYLPGWGGLRIEDCVAITENTIKNFSDYPKTLEEMTII